MSESCGYCHGIGACPRCWGRAGIDELKTRLTSDLAAARGQIAAKDAEITRRQSKIEHLRLGINRVEARAERAEAAFTKLQADSIREINDERMKQERAEAELADCHAHAADFQADALRAEARLREVEAERDALREQLNIECGGCPTTPTYAQLRKENAVLRGDLREMAIAITAGERCSGLPTPGEWYAPRWIAESTIALARRHATPAADNPESYAPNGMGREEK